MVSLVQEKVILIVDDDADICTSLVAIFNAEGYRAITAKNGQEGLEAARTNLPNVILLDIMMPVLDGYGFIEARKNDPVISRIPVIVLSAGLFLDQLPRDIPRLPKPPELSALFALVDHALSGPRPTPEHVPDVVPTVVTVDSIADKYSGPESRASSPGA